MAPQDRSQEGRDLLDLLVASAAALSRSGLLNGENRQKCGKANMTMPTSLAAVEPYIGYVRARVVAPPLPTRLQSLSNYLCQ